MVEISRRVFSVFRTAPAIATPKCASNMAGRLGAITVTTSPGFTPALTSALASRTARSYICAQL